MSDITNIIDAPSGLSAQGREGTTVQTFALSLAAGFVLFGVQFTAFVIFRNYLWARKIYQPRSFLIPLKNRVDPPSNNVLRWILTLFRTRADTVLQRAGMDAYFFLRYLSMCLKIFLPLALVILPILLPVNAVHGKNDTVIGTTVYNVTGLDRLAWSNVSPENTDRYWAHLVLAVGVIAWVCFLFHEELSHYVIKRQEYLASSSHRLKASSTTVLITDVPPELCTTQALTELYDDLPGGIRRVWINKDHGRLVEKTVKRKETENLLENAETDLVRAAIKRYRKQQKKSRAPPRVTDSSMTEAELIQEELSEIQTPPPQDKIQGTASAADCEKDLQNDIQTKAAWTKYIDPKKRKTIRIPKPDHTVAFKIPIIGRFFSDKVDAIYYYRRELARLNQEIEKDTDQADASSLNGSVFIQFNTQKAAHMACQAVVATKPRQMLQKKVEISPGDINWAALNYSWGNRALRLLLFLFLFIIVIIVFGLISFLSGILSRLSTLAGSTSWLHWIGSLPSWLLSFIQGTLPSVILVILLSGPTPIVLRSMTNGIRGAITRSQGERSLQLWYFIFLLLELLIVPTVSSGLTSVVRDFIQSPTSAPNILATNLPSAANYYFSFLIVQALSISASSLCQSVRLFNYYVVGHVNTPDTLFQKSTFTHFTRIGSNIPWYTTFAVIGLVYSVIAPLILVFMLITFGLFYMVIKNNVLYVVRTGDVDSGGLWFPHAINQTFTGLYLMEVCLLGLFFLVHDANDNVACEAQGTIMAVCIALTIFYQLWLTKNFRGMFKYAPISLEGLAGHHDQEYEVEPLNSSTVEVGKDKEYPPVQSPESLAPQAEKDTQKHKRESKRPRRSTILSMSTVDRSSDLQAQKESDKERAKEILARLHRPLDEDRLTSFESTPMTANTNPNPNQKENNTTTTSQPSRRKDLEARIGNVLLPQQKKIQIRMMNDPISRMIMQHNDELEDLTADERDMLISVAFTHPVLRENKPSVWIPKDELGISDDEVRRTRELSRHLVIENRGAYLNRRLKVVIDKSPPDMSEFALVMAEL